jgi:hypothetical protein
MPRAYQGADLADIFLLAIIFIFFFAVISMSLLSLADASRGGP